MAGGELTMGLATTAAAPTMLSAAGLAPVTDSKQGEMVSRY